MCAYVRLSALRCAPGSRRASVNGRKEEQTSWQGWAIGVRVWRSLPCVLSFPLTALARDEAEAEIGWLCISVEIRRDPRLSAVRRDVTRAGRRHRVRDPMRLANRLRLGCFARH